MKALAAIAASLVVIFPLIASAQPAPAAGGQGQGQGGGQTRQRGQGGGQGGQNRFGGGLGNQDTLDSLSKIVTDLTDDQKAKLKTEFDAQDKDLQDWRTDFQDEMQTMRGSTDPDAMAKMQVEIQKLTEDREGIVTEHAMKIRALLTPEQATTWETSKLTTISTQRLAAASLTDDQKTQIKGLVADAVKQLLAATDSAGVSTATGHFWKQVVGTVLTDPQTAKLFTQQAGGIGGMMGGRMGGGFGGGGQRGQGGQGGGQRGQGGQGNNAGQTPPKN